MKSGLYGEGQISNGLVFNWSSFIYSYSPNHLKTGLFKIRTFLSRFQMVGLPDFRSHSKSEPFLTQPLFDYSKSRLVRISDPQCNFDFFKQKLTNIRKVFIVEYSWDPNIEKPRHFCVRFLNGRNNNELGKSSKDKKLQKNTKYLKTICDACDWASYK